MPFCCWYIAWTNDPSAIVGLIKICRALVQSVGRNHKIPDIFRKLLHNIFCINKKKKTSRRDPTPPCWHTPATFINMHKQKMMSIFFYNAGGTKTLVASAGVERCLLTDWEHDTVWESVPLRLAPSVLPTGSLQWISLLCVCLLSHCGGRQTCQSPEAASACLAVPGLRMWGRLLSRWRGNISVPQKATLYGRRHRGKDTIVGINRAGRWSNVYFELKCGQSFSTMCLCEQKKSVLFWKIQELQESHLSPITTLCLELQHSLLSALTPALAPCFFSTSVQPHAVCLIGVFAHKVYWCCAICTVDPVTSRRIERKTEVSVMGWDAGCAAAQQPDNDWSYGEDQGLHTRG